MQIRKAHEDDAPVLARLIADSNKDVAEKFGLTQANCPKHPSFCQAQWLATDFARGELFYMAYEHDEPVACIATEYPSPELAYLNRLAVLPAFRRRGIGQELVGFILELARTRGAKTVSIGVIGEHEELQSWYQRIGFSSGETKRFPHLPFSVRYMTYALAAM